MHLFHRLNVCLTLATALILSGCASTSPIKEIPPVAQKINQQHIAKLAQIQYFTLKGRLGVVTQKQGFSGGIDWQHALISDNIEVYSPLGGKVARIVKSPTGVTLTTQEGHSVKAQDAESLTEMTLGWRLPLAGLSDWALGKPTKSKVDASTWDEQGRLTTLKQDGWDISYENYAENNGYSLPSKIVLKSENVNLKLLVEKWSNIKAQ